MKISEDMRKIIQEIEQGNQDLKEKKIFRKSYKTQPGLQITSNLNLPLEYIYYYIYLSGFIFKPENKPIILLPPSIDPQEIREIVLTAKNEYGYTSVFKIAIEEYIKTLKTNEHLFVGHITMNWTPLNWTPYKGNEV
jgi:hypothetical protein